MHPAAKLQFERTVREFAQSRAVPEADRSPAPAWWWQPAMEVVAQHEGMGALMCYRLQLPVGSTYVAGAAVLMATLADQTSLPWPDEFPRKIKRKKNSIWHEERLALAWRPQLTLDPAHVGRKFYRVELVAYQAAERARTFTVGGQH
jgi:hypothetical protein